MIFEMHNCIDNCPEVVAHLHWKLWPWRPPQFHLPSPGSACCATLHCQVLHFNNIQCNFAIEWYSVQYCNWTIFSAILNMNNIQCNFVTVGLQCTASKFTSTIQLRIAKRWTKIWKYSRVKNSHMQGGRPSDDPYFTLYILLTVIVHLFVFLV